MATLERNKLKALYTRLAPGTPLMSEDLAALGVRMDVFFSEKSLYSGGRIEAALEALEAKGLIYTGALPPPSPPT